MDINKERLAAFTDAIAAIAATIMVLELVPPDSGTFSELLTRWPTLLAYINSFFLIYLVWFNHHNLFEKAQAVSPRVFLVNGVWLFFLTIVPFATAWVGNHPNETLPELFYLLTQLCWTVSFHVLDVCILRDNPSAARDASTETRSRLLIYGGLLIGCIAAWILPVLSLCVMLALVIGMALQMFRAGKRS